MPTIYIHNTLSDALINAAQNLFSDEKTELQPAHNSAGQSLHWKWTVPQGGKEETCPLEFYQNPFGFQFYFYITGGITLKREIDPFDYASDVFKALPRGILITSEAEDCVNAMTIGWGTIGIEWGVPIFTAYVRTTRFTYDLLERTGEFTICAPYGEKFSKEVTKAIGICGSRSGRDMDKLVQSGVHVVEADIVRPPAIKEFPLTFECRVVFSQLQPINDIDSRFKKFYVPNTAHSEPHVAYYGEILKSYIIED